LSATFESGWSINPRSQTLLVLVASADIEELDVVEAALSIRTAVGPVGAMRRASLRARSRVHHGDDRDRAPECTHVRAGEPLTGEVLQRTIVG